jgi:TPR repeat protein
VAGNATPLADSTTLARTNPASETMATPDKPKLPASDVAALLARGDDFLRTGDIASARLFYEHCAEAGDAGSALRLGETFDPVFLVRTRLPVNSSDMEKALFWYRRASDLGSSEARTLLRRLNAD